ncbi:hypothetical protein KU306_01605 [Haloferax larsenii]|uniref:SPW repeat-containing protein n=1 Tax=Haloferax larsenii TaxID=302484 RepID=A0ABY5RE50_HALLR|nr:hypothetical protein [Haloferax larsenii]UVE50622.1 hypothetical protein KU306_01605 [Haloferax larsenii]
MKRRFLFGLGVFDMVVLAFPIALFGRPEHLHQWVWVGGFAMAGLLLIAAGLRDSVGVGAVSLDWHVAAGLGYLCFGIGMVANTAPTLGGTREDVFFGALTIVTIVPLMVFMGIDFIRGGVHLDISKWE